MTRQKPLTVYREQRAVHESLKKAMVPDGEGADGKKYWRFIEDASDFKIGQQHGYSANQITVFRQQDLGMFLKPKHGRDSGYSREGRMQAMEDKLATLQSISDQLTTLSKNQGKLINEDRTTINALEKATNHLINDVRQLNDALVRIKEKQKWTNLELQKT